MLLNIEKGKYKLLAFNGVTRQLGHMVSYIIYELMTTFLDLKNKILDFLRRITILCEGHAIESH